MEYGVRSQTEVKRVAETLLDSPFPIAQDLLSLDGFTVQRAALRINLARGRDRVGLVCAVENLGDTYYREHFQFAPARGRSFTVYLLLRKRTAHILTAILIAFALPAKMDATCFPRAITVEGREVSGR